MYSQEIQRGSLAKFHRHHGPNVVLENNEQVATRHSSFAKSICFSEKPLGPGEIFLVEILETVQPTRWSGHIRIGLTQMNPDAEFDLPPYTLPDLVSMCPSWMNYITAEGKNRVYGSLLKDGVVQKQIVAQPGAAGADQNQVQGKQEAEIPVEDFEHLSESEDEDELIDYVIVDYPSDEETVDVGSVPDLVLSFTKSRTENSKNQIRKDGVLKREGEWTRTPCGLIQHKSLLPETMPVKPTDVGSRIGVMCNPVGENIANMHLIINGEDLGPCISDIPFEDGPIFGVVDVYGNTKKVRAVQVYGDCDDY